MDFLHVNPKVSKDFKNDTPGKERMITYDSKWGTVSVPVEFTEEVEVDEANLNDYAAKFKRKMGKTTYQTMTDWVDGIGKLTKRENKTLKRVLKPFTEGVVIRKGPPQIKFMWKRDKRVTESNKAKSLAALRTALAVSKYKKAGGKVEKQPPGIAKGALMFRGKGGTTRDDDEENRINRGVMSWKKLRHGKKKK